MPIDAHIEAFEENIHTLASMDVAGMWERLRAEFLDEYVRLERTGLSPDDMARSLRSFMDELSARPLEDLARQNAGVSYNQGRDVAIQTAAEEGEVQYVVRSEVLDTNTCRACSFLDGEVFEVGTPDYERYMPPAECLGGDRCRGFYVAIGEGQ